MTLTKSWLQKQITDLEATRDEITLGLDEDGNNTLAALKLALAGMEADQGRNPVLAYADSYRDMAKQGVESIPAWSVITDLERNIAPHIIAPQPLTTSERAELENYRNAQQVVPSDGRDQFEEWFKFHHGDEHSIAMLQRANGGANYIDPYVDLAWISWKDSRAAMLQGKADGKPELTVWYGPMPESNGKTNWTAMLHRKGQHPWGGIAIDCSEYPERTLYEADRMRHLIGELADEPDILAYDADKHSGYVAPGKADGNSPVIPDGWVACSERMPDDDIYVVAADIAHGEIYSAFAAWFIHGRFSVMEGLSASNYDGGAIIEMDMPITHWMPLPAAPQQESVSSALEHGMARYSGAMQKLADGGD